jgi:hypothetical protein
MRYPPEITLDNRRKYTVDLDMYEAIVAMVINNLVCYHCGGPYTTLHPQVMQNRYLDCYFKDYKNGLKYVGHLRTSQDGDQTHYFIDAKGKIYLSSTSQPEKPSESQLETLSYWHFMEKRASLTRRRVKTGGFTTRQRNRWRHLVLAPMVHVSFVDEK